MDAKVKFKKTLPPKLLAPVIVYHLQHSTWVVPCMYFKAIPAEELPSQDLLQVQGWPSVSYITWLLPVNTRGHVCPLSILVIFRAAHGCGSLCSGPLLELRATAWNSSSLRCNCDRHRGGIWKETENLTPVCACKFSKCCACASPEQQAAASVGCAVLCLWGTLSPVDTAHPPRLPG